MDRHRDAIRQWHPSELPDWLDDSVYATQIQPILDHVLTVERENPGRTIAVVITELVARRWYHYFLHNQRGELLSALLLLRGARRIAIVNLPWYLKS